MNLVDRPPNPVSDPAVEKTARGIRFHVHEVEAATARLPTRPSRRALTKMLAGSLVTCSDLGVQLVKDVEAQALILSAVKAYADHRPLVISPDAVWVTILQGFAHHINAHPERYRDLLVFHKGRKALRHEINEGYPPSDPNNDWPRVFEALAELLSSDARSDVGAWAIPEFSTTGLLERAAFQVALLDAFQPYYTYIVEFICGIPSIELIGSPEDWRAIEERIAFLDGFDLGWWTRFLRPIVAEFIAVSEGRVDVEHWSRIIKREESYGGYLLDGWLLKLVPYLKGKSDRVTRRSPAFDGRRPGTGLGVLDDLFDDGADHDESETEPEKEPEPNLYTGGGVCPKMLPLGLSRARLIVEHKGTDRRMEMIAGLIGVAQNDDGALETQFGWALRKSSDLSAVLDFLEERGDQRAAEGEVVGFGGSQLAELVEIDDRGGGGVLRTLSGEKIGRLLGHDERRWIHREKGRFSAVEKRYTPTGNGWQIHSVTWVCVAELDGRVLALDLELGRKENPRLYCFTERELLKSGDYLRIKKPLGAVLLAALSRP